MPPAGPVSSMRTSSTKGSSLQFMAHDAMIVAAEGGEMEVIAHAPGVWRVVDPAVDVGPTSGVAVFHYEVPNTWRCENCPGQCLHIKLVQERR
jgi:hypothetical protein